MIPPWVFVVLAVVLAVAFVGVALCMAAALGDEQAERAGRDGDADTR